MVSVCDHWVSLTLLQAVALGVGGLVQAVAIFLDAEKAFHSVIWEYMLVVLPKIGNGAFFLQLECLLYTVYCIPHSQDPGEWTYH